MLLPEDIRETCQCLLSIITIFRLHLRFHDINRKKKRPFFCRRLKHVFELARSLLGETPLPTTKLTLKKSAPMSLSRRHLKGRLPREPSVQWKLRTLRTSQLWTNQRPEGGLLPLHFILAAGTCFSTTAAIGCSGFGFLKGNKCRPGFNHAIFNFHPPLVYLCDTFI